jgi:hypothetical protein
MPTTTALYKRLFASSQIWAEVSREHSYTIPSTHPATIMSITGDSLLRGLPRATGHDATDGHSGHAKMRGDFSTGHGLAHLSDFVHLFLSQFRLRMAFAHRKTVAHFCIIYVVFLCSWSQMVRIDASPVVTGMQNAQAVRNGSFMDHVADAVSPLFSSLVAIFPVTGGNQCALPFPTPVRSFFVALLEWQIVGAAHCRVFVRPSIAESYHVVRGTQPSRISGPFAQRALQIERFGHGSV